MTEVVLIVDDDDLNREVMEAFLSLVGFSVLMTGSGYRALEITEAKLPDLIILDVRLPDLSGIEVCRLLKKNAKVQDIPIMMITGLSDPQVREKAVAAGVDLFFPRPFEGDEFTSQVMRLLHRN